MKIVQLVTRRQRRGAEVFATELADALHDRGHAATVLGLGPPPLEPLTPSKACAADLRATREGVLDLSRVDELARHLLQARPDVVQANGGYAMKYAVLARRSARADWPVVYRNIGLSSDWLRWPGQRAWNRWLLRQVEAVAAVGQASRLDLLRTYGLVPGRVRTVRCGVRTEPALHRGEGRRALGAAGVAEDAFVLLHVGSFTPEKNHAGLLRIVRAVRERVARVHLVLVGDGALRNALERQAPDYVHVLGVRSDVATLMAGADLLVLPSLTEGIPGVILEAGAQGLPAVAYDVGGVGEVVQDARTGRLVPRGDEPGAARAIAELARDAELRGTLSDRARVLVSEQYSLARSTEAFEALYEEVLVR